ncbi:TVP38/TMEM64 family protein [Methyloprofundus sp.]|uniref:TVP38/TMEM64 family protein n=1 Tax=Methyloprofundus sp. TaxID=2020875 RepID=UPI003D145BA8
MSTKAKETKYISYALTIFLIFVLLTVWSIDYLSVENINANKILIAQFVDKHYYLSVLIFFIACIIFVNSPVPLAAMVKLLGGFFFGFYIGALFNIIATIIACLVGFGLSRHAFKQTFEKRFYKRLKAIEDELESNGFYYILTLRLIMIVPYALTNILAGLSRISFKSYFLSTTLGVIPASLVYANAGSKLEQITTVAQLLREMERNNHPEQPGEMVKNHFSNDGIRSTN